MSTDETKGGSACTTPAEAACRMPGMEPFTAFRARHLYSTREQFEETVTEPHLLLTFSAAAESDDTIATLRVSSTAQLHGGHLLAIAPLRKRQDSNPFQEMITVGRAENNDLLVLHRRVSKFHAYFRLDGERWTITDGGSNNGTFVDGVRLVPRRTQPLGSGTRIQLSDVLLLEFLPPPALYAKVKLT